jgi:hypothetical protein
MSTTLSDNSFKNKKKRPSWAVYFSLLIESIDFELVLCKNKNLFDLN